jgi:uncharacterized coiled-coil protein SlyX
MTSPDLIRELQATRPTAPGSLRGRVRELGGAEAAQPRRGLRLLLPRPAFVLAPAAGALVLAIGAAGVVGLTNSGSEHATVAGAKPLPPASAQQTTTQSFGTYEATPTRTRDQALQGASVGATPGRAQRVAATLTIKVPDSDHVSGAAQDALDITRSLGGHVLNASVATGDEGQATLTVRIPVAKTQEAITRLSALGTIVSQQVSIEDLQERLDALVRRTRSVRAQIVRITARLESETLDAETQAALELRRRTLRTELRGLRSNVSSTTSEARFATIAFSVVTPASEGAVPTPSRLDRSLHKALDVLVWEGIVALVVLLVAAPLAILAVAAWLLRRGYRRHAEERLLAAS